MLLNYTLLDIKIKSSFKLCLRITSEEKVREI